MSIPASARVVPISDISFADIGEKFRLFGILILPDDPTSNIAQLHSLTGSKQNTGIFNKAMHLGKETSSGLLVDISLCIDDGSAALKESGSVVMVMGTLEQNLQTPDLLGLAGGLPASVDDSIILRAIVMTDASDVNLAKMEASIIQRRNFERSSDISA